MAQLEDANMETVTLRNLCNEAYPVLSVHQAEHNSSLKSELRGILEAALRAEEPLRIGTVLAEISRAAGLTDADVEALERAMANR